MATGLRPDRRPDWFIWNDPDPGWVRAHAEVPGFQWVSNGSVITAVSLHRSHFPLLPSGLQLGPEATFGRVPSGITLRPYQLEDLPFLRSRRGTLLAYEMRLGKTVTAACAHDPNDGMLVVAGPLASRDVWRQWIERVHGMPPIVLQGGRRKLDGASPEPIPGYPAYFVHYDILEAHTNFFASQKIGTLVLDECHLLQNRKTRRMNGANVLAPRSARIVGLSGTPMWSRPDSLYSVLHLITPGAWGTHFTFAKRYTDAQPTAHGWRYDGSSNEDELRARLAEMMIRRTWKDVAPDLPATTRVVEPVEVPIGKLAELEAAAVQASLARGTTTVAGYLATLRRHLSTVKIQPAVEAALAAVDAGHKVVIWVWHNAVGKAITEALPTARRKGGIGPAPSVFRLYADDSARVREDQVVAFRNATGPAVMVAGIAIGGVAIDLSCSDYAIFAELDWTPANVYQAEMRTFHPSRPHCVVYLHADVPVETKLIAALCVREGFQTALGMGFDEVARMVLDG